MKKIIVLLLFIGSIAQAQKIDYNKIILPKNAQNVDLGERLVQIAWENNPTNEAYRKQVSVAKQSVRLANWTWLNDIYGVLNLNEVTVNPDKFKDPNNQNTNPANLFPLYNFGLRLSLGTFVNMPIQAKRAREEMKIAEANLNSRKLTLRALVLVNYQNYLMNKELLKIQTDVTEDANAAYVLAEKKFKDGDLSFEEYNAALQGLNVEKVRKITSENAFMLAKIRLEEVVGVRMEDVE